MSSPDLQFQLTCNRDEASRVVRTHIGPALLEPSEFKQTDYPNPLAPTKPDLPTSSPRECFCSICLGCSY
eukprot:3474469-Amphidinium_carterae.1